MALRCRLAGLSLILALACAASAGAGTPAASFDEATRLDLKGHPRLAFSAYLTAAEAGMPEAEFNVAVMLDSGRGVDPDLTQAAVWYARAAAHGLSRAAYDLGQLYEVGQGVPRNAELARAWFEASKLPAARSHLAKLRPEVSDGKSKPTAPDLVAPSANRKASPANGGVELVWTSIAQPEPAQYYVELRSFDKSGSHEVFSTITRVSSVFVETPRHDSDYAWRVTTLEKDSGQYAASEWSTFRMSDGGQASPLQQSFGEVDAAGRHDPR